jgi:hypothetical protein
MTTLSHQDQIVARAFFAENQDAFAGWISRKDTATDHFAGAAEATAVFVMLCGALGKISGAMENIDKITKHAKKLATFAKDLFAGKEKSHNAEHFELSERLLILIFDNYMRSGMGISTDKLIALTGASQSEAEKELKRFESGGVVRAGKSGWLVVH